MRNTNGLGFYLSEEERAQILASLKRIRHSLTKGDKLDRIREAIEADHNVMVARAKAAPATYDSWDKGRENGLAAALRIIDEIAGTED